MNFVSTRSYEIDELTAVSKELIPLFEACDIVAFEGEMGAGKTTLIKALIKQMGCDDNVSSPTYSLVNKYLLNEAVNAKTIIYHFDLFRLQNIDELLDIGFEEYLDSEQFIFIEWPQLAAPILSYYKVLHLKFEKIGENSRKMDIFMNY